MRKSAFAAFVLAVWLLLLHLVWQDTLAHPAEVNWNLYAYSDWLIDYAGGFVRRGLAGELLRRISGGPIAPATLNVIVFASYVAISIVLLAKIAIIGIARARFLPALVLLFVPGGLYTMAAENEYYIRKEILFVLFLWGAAELATRLGRQHAVFIAYVGLGSIVLSCVHEAFIFFCAIPVALLIYDSSAPRRSLTLARFYLLMCGAALALFVFFEGTLQTRNAIWQSIGSANRALLSATGEPQLAIRTIGWSLWDALELPAHLVEEGMAWYWLVPLLFSAAICAYLAVAGRTAQDGRRLRAARALLVFGFILVGTLPLFALGWDWGRWIGFTTLAFLIVFDHIGALPDPLERLARRVADGLPRVPAGGISAAACGFALLIFELTFRMPACCINSQGNDWSAMHVLARAVHRVAGG